MSVAERRTYEMAKPREKAKGTPARISKADTYPSHRGILQAQARAEEQLFNATTEPSMSWETVSWENST